MTHSESSDISGDPMCDQNCVGAPPADTSAIASNYNSSEAAIYKLGDSVQ